MKTAGFLLGGLSAKKGTRTATGVPARATHASAPPNPPSGGNLNLGFLLGGERVDENMDSLSEIRRLTPEVVHMMDKCEGFPITIALLRTKNLNK